MSDCDRCRKSHCETCDVVVRVEAARNPFWKLVGILWLRYVGRLVKAERAAEDQAKEEEWVERASRVAREAEIEEIVNARLAEMAEVTP